MNLDIIGKLYNIVDEETVIELEGWHVNSSELLPELEAHRVEPSSVRRVFAGYPGVPTYFYKFASEEEANEMLGISVENELSNQ